MKRSKIFLATTAALLGVVGVFAAKAHHRFNIITAWGPSVRVRGCTIKVQGFFTTTQKNNDQQVAATQYNMTVCITPLYLDGQ